MAFLKKMKKLVPSSIGGQITATLAAGVVCGVGLWAAEAWGAPVKEKTYSCTYPAGALVRKTSHGGAPCPGAYVLKVACKKDAVCPDFSNSNVTASAISRPDCIYHIPDYIAQENYVYCVEDADPV